MIPTPLRPSTSADQVSVPAGVETPSPANPVVLRLRAVHRAVADMRRGTPVVLRGGSDLVLLAAEAAGERGLAELHQVAEAPVLLLAPARAASVLRRPVVPAEPVLALRLPESLLQPQCLRGLADPTVGQVWPAEPVLLPEAPDLAPAALALVKLSRLLPAVLAAPFRPEGAERAAAMKLLDVAADDVLAYPQAMAARLERVTEAKVPLEGATDARIVAFRAPDAGVEHLAILIGQPERAELPLVRLHSECFTGDLLGSLRCDCGAQLRGAIRRMAEEGAGVLLYLAQEGRGIGLVNKLRAYALQDRGLDTVDANRALGWGADERNFMIASTMLEALGVRRLRLLTNNPDKMTALVACGVDVVRRESLAIAPNGVNDKYLATKVERFGHLLG
jgi:GTP cyclohydrolase II